MTATNKPLDFSSFQTLYNIRDLGGFPTRGGQTTVHGRFLRSDAPVRLNSDEVAHLRDLPVKQIIDLRSPSEIDQTPYPLADLPDLAYSNIALLGRNLDSHMNQLERLFYSEQLRRPELVDLYLYMIDYEQEKIGRVMHTLAMTHCGARLFHCSHGKDRTGLISALLLLLADVPRAHIVSDYAISEKRLQPWFDLNADRIPESHQRFLMTPAHYMEKTLDHLVHKHGTVSRYLEACQVTAAVQDQLKALLLDPDCPYA